MKVRIKETPREPEVDGVRLDSFHRGQVREVSASIGSWLVAEGYAEPEMRLTNRGGESQEFFEGFNFPLDRAHDRRSRKR